MIRDQQEASAHQRPGLFLAAREGRLTTEPLVCANLDAAAATNGETAPAIIEMFGRFEMSINGQQIAWGRRRDRQIVAFLAGRPHARATRAEVIATFWPGVDRRLAGQSLRTACSTIRRALAAAVGRSNVERYFIGDVVLELVVENSVISSREFEAQYDLSTRAYERSDLEASLAHARAASLLYRSPFLVGEPPAAWALPCERRFAQMGEAITSRIRELGLSRGMYTEGRLPTPELVRRRLVG